MYNRDRGKGIMEEKDLKLNEEILELQKRNRLNNLIIVILAIILLAVCAVAIYVRIV